MTKTRLFEDAGPNKRPAHVQVAGPGQPAPCSGDQLRAADLDDNGVVNEYDDNLYLRALSR